MVFSPHFDRTGARADALPNPAGVARRRWALVLIAAVAALAVVYLIQINAVATKGYEITSLQRELEAARHTASKLEVQAAELQSLKSTQSLVPDKSFVAVQHLEYLSTTAVDTGVAVR